MSAARSRMILAAVALAAAGMVASLLVPSTTAGAASSAAASAQAGVAARAVNYYGSIALSPADGAVGWSYDYRTRRGAIKRAKRECRQASDYPWRCRKVGWVRNGCLALAVRWNGSGGIARWASAYRYGKRAAYRAAKKRCGPGCRRRAFTCTTR